MSGSSMRKGRQYEALQEMQPASTVDSFQGQENDVVVVIMGTAHPKPGPGFTCNPKRLKVMLSRQKSALVIVGDINVASKQARYEVIDETSQLARSMAIKAEAVSVWGEIKVMIIIMHVSRQRYNVLRAELAMD
ncbi:hypothetical protein HG531_001346 [Fusarium graminearum]|nr:hypothetical protein HG531_001346 [Fusarium graminearum]